MILTDARIRKLPAGDRQVDHLDARLPDFGIRVSSSGVRTFFVRYRHGGRRRRIKIGRWPSWTVEEARARAEQILRSVAHGRDPRAPTCATFAELAERYLAWAKLHKRSWQEDRRQIRQDLLPRWGGLPPGEITRADVLDLLHHIRDERSAPIQANRRLALIRKMFNFAGELEIVESNPAAGISRPAPERVRDRVLSVDELRAVWRAMAQEDTAGSRLCRVLLLTGQRVGETKAMRRDEIEGSWWSIPGERTKNGRPQRVYLAPLVWQVIAQDVQPLSEWMFPGSDLRRHVAHPHHAARRIVRRSGVSFRLHDLRRTFATGLAQLGTDPHVIAACLNHAPSSVTARHYDRYSYDAEKRHAWESWSAHVAETCGLGAVAAPPSRPSRQ